MSKQHKQQPLLQVKNLVKEYVITNPLGRVTSRVKAVNDVSFDLYERETLGIVGESGSGKSTTGRTIIRLTEATSGEVIFNGQNILALKEKEFLPIRKHIQMIFQDPNSSLNPRKRIGDSIEEPMVIQKIGNKEERQQRAFELLEKVGLRKDHYFRFPHEFSGGQRQRIGIARALAVTPKIVICDEPVSALDVSIQSQVINLMEDLQDEFGLAYLFIAHDLSVVRHISDRIAVMYLGNIVELAPTDELFENPQHPYTKTLLSAIPSVNPKTRRERIVIKGDIPSPTNLPTGCVFHTRCPFAMDICKQKKPEVTTLPNGHHVACHLQNNATNNTK